MKLASDEILVIGEIHCLNILKYFEPIPSEYIPAKSLLKEFLGGGYFEY